MNSFDDRIKHVSLKLGRAKEHFELFNLECERFMSSKPFKMACKINSERKPAYFIMEAAEIPDSLGLIAGDCVQNLVTALDHLAYQLVCKDTNNSPPYPNKIYFPIADDHDSYNKKKIKCLRGAKLSTIAAIDQIKPYKEGNNLLWCLQKINSIEKHRLLFTIALNAGFDVMEALRHSDPIFARFKGASIHIHEKTPAKVGTEVYIGQVDEPCRPMEFSFYVSLEQMEGERQVELGVLLKDFGNEVKSVIDQLSVLLR
ncbi:hypothetical protein [Cellvibrio sp. UBA7661]|uniref:hypothetical protein n=1 Tax=Cellvibrio sp. UBA7661 TaxID=1946311 RepID=UPI002F35AA78